MSTSWSLNALQLATLAYRKLGILPSGGVPTDDQWNQAVICLNAMLKGMQSKGINLYRQTQIQATVPALTGYPGNPFILTPTILGFEEARFVVNNQAGPSYNERPLGAFTYVDYMLLPNKQSSTPAGPSIVCFDKQAFQSNFYFFPLNPFSMQINMTVGRTVNDVVNPTDQLDFPTEWTEGMSYSLADRLMDDEGVAAADEVTADRIVKHAMAFIQELLDFDRPTSIMVRPYGRRGRGKFWR